VWVDVDGDLKNTELVDEILASMQFYKGSGIPTFYTTLPTMTQMLLARDDMGRRFYRTAQELASELGVDKVVRWSRWRRSRTWSASSSTCIDYTVGADRGGEVSMFDNFDIDYNQYKYLLETRASRRADQDPVGDHRAPGGLGAAAGDPGGADVRPGHLADHDRGHPGRDLPSQRHQRGRHRGGLAVHGRRRAWT
jgi:hypothetical protein